MTRKTTCTMQSMRLASMVVLAILLLSSCGMWQSVKDTTSDATRAVFVTKVKQMNLVIESRTELNLNARGQSLPVVLRVYQLRDATAFGKAGYAQLLRDDRGTLKADMIGRMEATLGPDSAVRLSASMPDDAQYVGVAGFFLDRRDAEWQLVIPRSQWKKTDPVKLIVTGNRMELLQ